MKNSIYIEKRKLMQKYAELCGYKYTPFGWNVSDYSIAGWKKLITDIKNRKL